MKSVHTENGRRPLVIPYAARKNELSSWSSLWAGRGLGACNWSKYEWNINIRNCNFLTVEQYLAFLCVSSRNLCQNGAERDSIALFKYKRSFLKSAIFSGPTLSPFHHHWTLVSFELLSVNIARFSNSITPMSYFASKNLDLPHELPLSCDSEQASHTSVGLIFLS